MRLKIQLVSSLVALTLLLAAVPVFAADAPSGVVNINTADAGQLALLPRVGPAVAQRILDYREENGEFKSLDDLMLVRGIGEKTFSLLEPYVAISGKTTLEKKVHVSRQQPQAEDDAR